MATWNLINADDPLKARNAIGWNGAVQTSTGGIVPLERFDPDGEGFHVALAAAIDEADANGGVVTFERAKTYTATAAVEVADKHVRIDFNGAKVIRDDSAPATVLAIDHSHSEPQDVVAVTTDTFTPSWPNTLAVTTRVSRIEVASTAGWSVGDYAVIVSDDHVPWATGSATTTAERFRVAAIDSENGYLYSGSPLRVTLTTDIRIARMVQKDCVLDNVWIEDEPGTTTARSGGAFIDIGGAVRPVINNATVRNLIGRGFRIEGCVDGRITGGEVSNLRTKSSDGDYGYGFDLPGCCDFRVSGLDSSFVRHGVTTNITEGVLTSEYAPTRNNFRNYGGSIGHRFFACTGTKTGSAAYDWHTDALDCLIDGVHVRWNQVEPEGMACAFQMRGKDNEIRDCSSVGTGGIRAYGIGPAPVSHRIANYTHTLVAAADTPSDAGCIKVDGRGMDGTDRVTVNLDDVTFVALDAKVKLLQTFQADIYCTNLDVRWEYTGSGATYPFVLTDTALHIDTLTLDISGSNSNGTIPFRLMDSDSSVHINRLVVRTGDTGWTLCNFNSLDGAITIGRLETDRVPNSGLVYLNGAGATWAIGDMVVDGVSVKDELNLVDNTNTTNTHSSSGLQVMNTPLTGHRGVTESTVNLHPGREILYVRTSAATGGGTYVWTIGSGGPTLDAESTWLRRMWTGSAWVTVAQGDIAESES